ncbi:nucleotidyltransferase domain-containing protein [Phenylobacterium sp.]|jgi:hypothetical protein|uniref:nucleotidyltransferase domain-containing protein n=1 Tax=Phenylobacterium sp. TaxID=1871053 RepID=UPI002E366939|nr:hypothetical protein [Phenylobacterium sp.]HEX2561557.1 hypothetical protein [Phenylobacterium sp.]
MSEKGGRWDGPGLEAWRGAWTPAEAAEKLSGLEAPWCVVGGWAIDLFLGRETRSHGDLEIAIAKSDLPEVRAHLAEYRFHAAGDGEVRALSPGELPPSHMHQTWVLDEAVQLWRVDVMQEPGDRDTWVFRRDARIFAPRAQMIASMEGVPYLRPEGALLYKAKAQRPKDEADFAACAPYLGATGRAWLRETIATLYPGHAWAAALDEA